jgi:hypothetical protein
VADDDEVDDALDALVPDAFGADVEVDGAAPLVEVVPAPLPPEGLCVPHAMAAGIARARPQRTKERMMH